MNRVSYFLVYMLYSSQNGITISVTCTGKVNTFVEMFIDQVSQYGCLQIGRNHDPPHDNRWIHIRI